jgi:hypothetical protein
LVRKPRKVIHPYFEFGFLQLYFECSGYPEAM